MAKLDLLQHELSPEEAKVFIQGGKAIITIQSKVSGKHFTYKLIKPKKSYDLSVSWIYLMNGPDNNSSYVYMGHVSGGTYKHGKRNGDENMSKDSTSVKAFVYWYKALRSMDLGKLSEIRIFHAGVCSCCGRTLTTPESIKSGIGPVCRSNPKLRYIFS